MALTMAWGVITWIVIFGVAVAIALHNRFWRSVWSARREALDAALLDELLQVQQSASVDLARYGLDSLDAAPRYDRHPAVTQARVDWKVQGEIGYHRSFVWTPLLTGAISQAIREASFLRVAPEQILQLSELSGAILRANARIASKNALLPAVVQGGRPLHIKLTYDPDEWAAMVADQLNRSIEADLREISQLCSKNISARYHHSSPHLIRPPQPGGAPSAGTIKPP